MKDELQALKENDAWVSVDKLPPINILCNVSGWLKGKTIVITVCVTELVYWLSASSRGLIDFDETFSLFVGHLHVLSIKKVNMNYVFFLKLIINYISMFFLYTYCSSNT